MNFQLKPGLLLGTASAATQIEGGSQNNSWHAWYRKGRIKDGSDPSVATDHYVRWQEDLELMAGMGIQCCRLGVEWSRVEPEDGVFDDAVIAHYRDELQALVGRGIRPLLTLHHFSNPLWLEEKGAFAKRDNITYFLRCVRRMVEGVGDLVSEYITINEPNVYAYNGYFEGTWPPGKRNLLETARVMTNLTAAHIEAYGLIRKTRLAMGFTDTRVGVSPQLRVFAPKNPQDPVHRFWASRSRQIFQASLIRAMYTGRASFPIGGHPSIVPGRYCDFHAPSYGGRSVLSGPAMPAEREADPAGAVQICRALYALLPRPLWVTGEGGALDAVRQLQALCACELPVEAFCCRGTEAREALRRIAAQGGMDAALYERLAGEEDC